jgi:hypothetical protein
MYAITDVLTNIEQHLPWVMFWTAIAWGSGFVQVVESLRLSVRDRIPGVPLGMAIFLLAHDSTFFMRYDYWLHTVNHWYFSIFWVGMGISVFIELFLIYCILRDGRQQLAPHLSPRAFFLLIVIFQVATYLLLWWLQSLLADPLYLVSLLGTQVAAVMFNIPMLLVRGNTKGQSRIYAWATLLGPGSLALGLFPALSPIFHTGLFAGLCLTLAALSIAYVVLLEQYRRSEQSVAAS